MKQLSAIRIVWLLFKSQISYILSESQKSIRKTFAKIFKFCVSFTVSDSIVLFFLCFRLETHPGQTSLHKVHDDMEDSLEVISSSLFYAVVRMNGSISSCSS